METLSASVAKKTVTFNYKKLVCPPMFMPGKQLAALGFTTYIVVSLRFGLEVAVLTETGEDAAMELRAQIPETTNPTATQPNRVKTLCVKIVDTMPATVATTGAYNFAVFEKVIFATSMVIMF